MDKCDAGTVPSHRLQQPLPDLGEAEQASKVLEVGAARAEQQMKPQGTTPADGLQLAAALAAWEDAVNALSRLSKADVRDLREMDSPPPGVLLTCQALCVMFDVAPGEGDQGFWEAAKRELLANPRLLCRMVDFDQSAITASMTSVVRPLCDDPECELSVLEPASVAAASIVRWVRALLLLADAPNAVASKKESSAVDTAKVEPEARSLKLNIWGVSGEMLLAIPDASSAWTRREVLPRLAAAGHVPSALHIYSLACAEKLLTGSRRLAELAPMESLDLSAVVVANEAEPALSEAREAVLKVDVRDLGELRALARPPAAVMSACAVLCKLWKVPLLGPTTDWKTARAAFLQEPGPLLIDRIRDHDCDARPEEDLAALREYVQDPASSPERVATASRAFGPVASWCHALARYDQLIVDGEAG